MAERDPYEVLGVSRDATPDQIKAAHRRLARELHPDVNNADDASERFAEVQRAYAILSDPERRSEYDRFGHAGARGRSAGGPRSHPGGWPWSGVPGSGAPGSGGPGAAGVDAEDFGDLFDTFFNQNRRPNARTQARARDGADLEATLRLDFETSASGGERELRVADRDGTVVVRIPSAIADGTKLRIAGQGQPAPTLRPGRPGRPGDLIVTIRVEPHPLWKRRRDDEGKWTLDLEMDLPVTVLEAVEGAAVDVPTPRGVTTVRVPPNTSGGRTLRLKGRGLLKEAPRSSTASAKEGDLFLRVRIVPPPSTALDEVSRRVLKDLSDRTPGVRDAAVWPKAQSQPGPQPEQQPEPRSAPEG